MAITIPIPELKQFLTDPEGTGVGRRDAEQPESLPPADAEEEEIAQLWAADPGNQGA